MTDVVCSIRAFCQLPYYCYFEVPVDHKRIENL